MKNSLRQVFHSPKFVVGFVIFGVILLTMFIYPLLNPGNPLEMVGQGTFAKPGTYISLYDSVGTKPSTLKLDDADANRLAQILNVEDRVSMVNWLSAAGVSIEGLNMNDTDALLALWRANYDPAIKPQGMTKAQRNYYVRLNNTLNSANSAAELIVTEQAATGEMAEKAKITKTDYVNIGDVANVKILPLGTDNFGRDTLKELISACGTSIMI
ncbi:MAG: ABC transporter permease, partial [Clostridia bacterium]